MPVTTVEGSLDTYLRQEIFPRVARPPYGRIDAACLSKIPPVYLYHDALSHAKVVGKYFKFGAITLEKAWENARKEYGNLKFLRDVAGLRGSRYEVIAPLGLKKEYSALLVLEYAPGNNLDHYIRKAIFENKKDELFHRLTSLAGFFARLHRTGTGSKQVTPANPAEWMNRIVNQLKKTTLKNHYGDVKEIENLAGDWWNRKYMFDDNEVIIHGDATTTNFTFHQGKVIGIDLEDMRRADRTWDLGFIAAELKHNFMWHTGDGGRAEPFIGHFLWEYGKAYNDTGIFHKITPKLPLFMAIDLLRISRNDWLNEDYRLSLVKEARECLKYRR